MLSRIRALVVEDDEDDFLITEELLEELPYPVEITWLQRYDGALEKLIEGADSFDIGFIDYRIGAHTGLEFVRAAKAKEISTPLVLLTGVGQHDIDVAATEAGAADFLDKSELTVGTLERTVRYAIAHADALRALAAQSALLKTTLENTGAGIAALDADFQLIERNAQFDAFFDAFVQCRRSSPTPEIEPIEEGAVDDLRALLERIRGAESQCFEVETPEGRVFEARANAAPRGGQVIVAIDVTASKQHQRRLAEYASALEAAKAEAEYEALYDSLTGLANRRHLDDHFAHLASEADGAEPIALLHIDLDRFKQINDTLGHAAGDHVLRYVAETLTSRARAQDFTARIGGDEFVIVCQPPTDFETASALAQDIVRQLSAPVSYEGRPCRFGASVGVAVGDSATLDPAELLVNADLALYRAKANGRNRVEQFSSSMQTEIFETKRTADHILQGLERDEFFPVFQPQFDAKAIEFCGIEALGRWRHPERGVLPPGAFLQVAEDLNVLGIIDRLILEKSIEACNRMAGKGFFVPKLSANLSYRRLCDPDFLPSLDKLPATETKLALELVETIFLDHLDDDLKWTLDGLRERGFELEIDDFGSGRASMIALIRIAPDRLKIDRELIEPVCSSGRQRELIQAIVDIGRTLNIGVTAEGVATRRQATLLREIGCDTLQGFALGKPTPELELPSLIEAHALSETLVAAG
ncbi:MAG: EAL domain-containing protein [Pseudomonadota bacterium]